jgi:hypothetical protein
MKDKGRNVTLRCSQSGVVKTEQGIRMCKIMNGGSYRTTLTVSPSFHASSINCYKTAKPEHITKTLWIQWTCC